MFGISFEYWYLYFALYIIVLFLIIFFVGYSEKKEDFLIAGRDRTWWQIMFSKFASSIGIAWLITYTGYAYFYGFGVYIIMLGFLLGYSFFAFFLAPRIYAIGKKYHCYTQGDFVLHRTESQKAKIITNLFSIFIQMIWLLVCIIGGAKVMESLGIMSYEIALIFTVMIVFFYVSFAGYKGVLITDIFQSFIIIGLLGILGYFTLGEVHIVSLLQTQREDLNFISILGFFLYGFFVVWSLSDRYQLVYASKTKRDITIGMFLTFIPIALLAFLVVVIGLFVYSQNPTLDKDLVFLEALQYYIPASLFPLGVVLLYAGLMSSADTGIYAITSHVVLKRKGIGDSVKKIRQGNIILLFIVFGFALVFRDIIEMTVFGAAISVVMSIPMLYIIFGKSVSRFFSSMIGGFIGLIISIYFIGLEPSIILFVLIGGALGLLKK